jgi:hypothetical protein
VLLRAEVGVVTIIHGATYWSGHSNSAHGNRAVCALLVAAGVLLLVGFLTPAASVLVALGGVGLLLSWLPEMPLSALGSKSTSWFAAIVAIAIAMLGPGAYSLDARVFGRREVIVPRAPTEGSLR